MMRLRRLRLPRYGLFTDREIDFGPAPEDGAPDLHVIYGPNEAGKSTVLAGFLDLLFAIEQRSGYGFLHGYGAMRVEADLEIGGETRRFVRTKRREGGLRGGDGRPVPEGALAAGLGGMDRAAYRAMFSLDDETLEAGGEQILQSEGDLGRLLFETGAGLVELGGTLKRLREDAEGFHKSRARSTGLIDLKARLGELAERKKDVDTAAGAYARLADERGRARAAHDEAAAETARLERIRTDAERRLRGLPLLADVRRRREELAGPDPLPEIPQVWFERIGRLVGEIPRLTTRVEVLGEAKRKLDGKLQALAVDDAVLALEDRIARLDDARYATAEDDLPRRRAELGALEGEVAAVLRRLERPPGADPASLAVPAAVAGALHELVERRSGIEARLKAAADELEAAQAEAEAAAEALEAAGAGPEGGGAAFDRLAAALAAAQDGRRRGRLEAHMQQRRRRGAELDQRLAQLRPWSGGARDLARVEAPGPGELGAWRERLEAAERETARLEDGGAALAAERERQARLAQARKAETGIEDDEGAAKLRAARDEAWARHRAAPDSASADAFEERMTAYDAAADARLAHAAGLAGMRRAGEALREAEAGAARNAAALAAARRRRREVLDEVAAAVAAMIRSGAADLPPDMALPALSGWIDRRAGILAALEEAAAEDAEIEAARAEEERGRAALAAALAAAGAAPGPQASAAELEAEARAALDADRDRRAGAAAARQRSERAQAALDRRRGGMRRARKDDEDWRAAWAEALSRCWLGGVAPPPSGPEVRRILEDAQALDKAHRSRAALAARIEGMERDRAAYAGEVEEVAAAVGEAFDAARARAGGAALKARLARAAADRKARDGLRREIAEAAAAEAAAQRALAELRAEARPMFDAFGVETLEAVSGRLQEAAHRAKAREELAERERRLVEALEAGSLREAEDALAAADRDALEEEAAAAAARLADAAERRQESYHAWRQAEDALAAVGGDDAAARLEQERRTVLVQIEEGARGWLRTRLGVEAAERALAAWRDAHRSSMMERASAAFRTISRGAYSRLAAEPSDRGETLIAVPAGGGGAKIASAMSKGARFQLYLALRVAGYREFADRHGPVPFVADDILETFDDLRAEEAFRLFAEMAGFGQVIYLSHHRHLCRIAREVCPTVAVHELPGAGAPAPQR